MSQPYIQPSLNAGEFAPALYGRVDLAKYKAGCSTLRNMVAAVGGGAMSRAGTKFVGVARQDINDPPPQLIPFQYSITQGYLLVLSDQEMSVVANGAFVTKTPFAISNITSNADATFTAPGNDFSVGDWVFLDDISGPTFLNGQTVSVSSLPVTGSFTAVSIFNGDAIDTTTASAYSAGGTAAEIFVLPTPYVSADLQSLKWSQSADVLSITHPNYPPMDVTRISNSNWTLTTTSFSASISPPTTLSATATTITTTFITQYQYVVTAVDTDDGEESIASPVATARNSVNIAQQLGSETLSWPFVTGADHYNIYKAPAALNGISPVGSLFGYAGSSYGLTFVDSNIVQDMSTTPPQHANPFAPRAITAFSMTATGSGWSGIVPPNVTITDSTGNGAIGQAVVVDGGVQAIYVVNGGHDYTSPTITISYNTGTGASFSAVANGNGYWDGGSSPANVTINSGGTGYTQGNVTVVAQYPFPPGVGGTNTTLFATSVTVAAGAITAVTFPITSEDQKPVAINVSIFAIGASTTTASATASIGPSTGTYPSCVSYFQQRRFYANTLNNPDTYWGSQPGAYTNMDASFPSNASDAIVGTPWGQQVNGIQAMVPMPGGLVILTGLGAWQLSGGAQGQPVTPDNQFAQAQAYNGCNELILPITINYDILYVQQKGSIVRDLNYNFFTNIYTGTDLTVLSPHLFTDQTIERWAWAEEPYRLVWVVRGDGTLLSLTYLKEQDIYAWARHDTNGQFRSVATVTEPPVDAAYFVVERTYAG